MSLPARFTSAADHCFERADQREREPTLNSSSGCKIAVALIKTHRAGFVFTSLLARQIKRKP